MAGTTLRKITDIGVLKASIFFPKQFAVGVLNATLNLAALVLVGVAAFLGSEVVLATFDSLHVRCERKMSAEKHIIHTFQQVFDQTTRFNLNLLKLFGVHAGVIVRKSGKTLREVDNKNSKNGKNKGREITGMIQK